MLHRTLATGVDLFTSSAILSDAELETLAARASLLSLLRARLVELASER